MKATELDKGSVLISRTDAADKQLVQDLFIGTNPRTALVQLAPLAAQNQPGIWRGIDEIADKYIIHTA